MFVSYLPIHMLNTNPQGNGLGGGVSWKRLGHEGRDLVNGISALINETPEKLVTPSTICGHSKEASSMRKQALVRHQICWCLNLRLLNFQNCEKYMFFVYKLPSLCLVEYSSEQPEDFYLGRF